MSWVDIEGYEGLYQVNEEGQIKSLGGAKKLFGRGKSSRVANVPSRILKPAIDNAGYKYVSLSRDGAQKTFNIHRIVAKAFVKNPKNLRDVNHKNGVKTDNRVGNLEWVSHSDNIKHSYEVLGRKRNNWSQKKVQCVETGVIYNSITKAAEECKTRRSAISKCLAGNGKTAGGVHWRLYES